MDSRDLRYFVALYKAANFSRAAISLDTVQSNVSGRIAELERRLGVPLFHRRYRALVPTASGRRLYASARPLVAALDALDRRIKRWLRGHKPGRSKKAA